MKNRWESVLEAAANACAGEDGCCGLFENGSCCMTENAREVFRAIHDAGGPSLEQCEAIARGEVIITRPVKVGE